jgi:hypothetical protein
LCIKFHGTRGESLGFSSAEDVEEDRRFLP